MKSRSTASVSKAWYTGRPAWLQGQEWPGPIQARRAVFPQTTGPSPCGQMVHPDLAYPQVSQRGQPPLQGTK